MMLQSLSRSRLSNLLSPSILRPPPPRSTQTLIPWRLYHDRRPRGPLWRGKKMIGKEALFVILGLKRFKDDDEKPDKFCKSHVLRLLKIDKITVITKLERQDEVALALKWFWAWSCMVRIKTDSPLSGSTSPRSGLDNWMVRVPGLSGVGGERNTSMLLMLMEMGC